MKKIYEIRIHARAGQGSKTLAQLIAEIASEKGYYVQAFPYFGPARSGAPMDAFVRISKKEIKQHTPIKDPNLLIILDETLLLAVNNICLSLDKNQDLLINSVKNSDKVRDRYKLKSKVYAINANKIADELFKNLFINTVMLGAYAKVSELITLKEVKDMVKKKFIKKYGPKLTQANIKAVERGYNFVK